MDHGAVDLEEDMVLSLEGGGLLEERSGAKLGPRVGAKPRKNLDQSTPRIGCDVFLCGPLCGHVIGNISIDPISRSGVASPV